MEDRPAEKTLSLLGGAPTPRCAMATPQQGGYHSVPKPGICAFCRKPAAVTFESDTAGKRICKKHLDDIVSGRQPKVGENK